MRTWSLNQDWMPTLKKMTEKTATTMAGVTAIKLNSTTSRTCRREPAEPRRRAPHKPTMRRATTAPSISSSARSTLTRISTVTGSGPNGADWVMTM